MLVLYGTHIWSKSGMCVNEYNKRENMFNTIKGIQIKCFLVQRQTKIFLVEQSRKSFLLR